MNDRLLTDPDLIALDEIWPIGRQLAIADVGTVIVAGAYRGRYMHYLVELYPKAGLILGFEPQRNEVMTAFWRIHKYSNCAVVGRALGVETTESVPMGRWGTDGCSLVASSGSIGKVSMVEFAEGMKQHRVTDIDCFICNMEGYEYILLPHIFKNKLHERIKSMAVQFHSDVGLGEKTIRAVLNAYYGEPIKCPGWDYWRKQ